MLHLVSHRTLCHNTQSQNNAMKVSVFTKSLFLKPWLFKCYTVPVNVVSVWTATFFIHSVVCLTTNPQPLPKRFLHTVRSSASSFNFLYPVCSFRSSGRCLRVLSHFSFISVTFNVHPFFFLSAECICMFCMDLRKKYFFVVYRIKLGFAPETRSGYCAVRTESFQCNSG